MPRRGPPLGAHVSIAGSVSHAIGRGEELGCDALQIFVKNPSQWRASPLDEEEADRFRQIHADSSIGSVVAHASYLINLASTDSSTLERSRRALGEELDRSERLGLDGLVLHPGAHLGSGEETGLGLVAESLDRVLGPRVPSQCRILLENTAGQGTVLGHRLSHLAKIRELCSCPERIGVCVDTCHAYAAGYPLDDEKGYESFFDRITKLFGSDEPRCLHLNDSKKGFESRRDRHANLGEGEIGLPLFKRLVHDPRLRHTPMILETPLGDDGHAHDLAVLRSL